jgi:hypothetical protein
MDVKRHFRDFLSYFFFFCSLSFFACAKNTAELDTGLKNASNVESNIKKVEERIIQNITNHYDIDNEIDIDGIRTDMEKYELLPNSCLVKIDNKIYDTLIIASLLKAYANIRIYWYNTKNESMQKLVTTSIKSRIEKQETDDYALVDEILYYSYQFEIAKAFFPYLLEQFQLTNDQHNLNELPEITIKVLPLSMTAISIDKIPYESIAAETLQELMKQKADELMRALNNELAREINTQYEKCENNIDSYLDWYYGFTTGMGKTWEMFKGAIDPNKTAAEAMQEYMIKNYTEKIGYGVDFNEIIGILQNRRDEALRLALVFAATLEDCILDQNISVELKQDITGDNFMSAFIAFPDYLNKVVSEGLPIMGMGNKLDTDGVIVLDIANLVVNFIPGVGFIAGIGLDYLTLKLTESWKRPEFKDQIIYSIRDTKEKLLEIIRIDGNNTGEEYEIAY